LRWPVAPSCDLCPCVDDGGHPDSYSDLIPISPHLADDAVLNSAGRKRRVGVQLIAKIQREGGLVLNSGGGRFGVSKLTHDCQILAFRHESHNLLPGAFVTLPRRKGLCTGTPALPPVRLGFPVWPPQLLSSVASGAESITTDDGSFILTASAACSRMGPNAPPGPQDPSRIDRDHRRGARKSVGLLHDALPTLKTSA
jgi:hypothetical protein